MKLTLEQLSILNQVTKKAIEEKSELYAHTGDKEWVLPELNQLEAIQSQIEELMLAQ